MAQDKKDSDVKYEVGNVVIGKVKGYPPWPGEIIDPDEAPSKVKLERPSSKKVTFYCVRFFPVGDHAWLPTKDVSRLLPHEIAAYLAEPSKRKGDLLEGYKIANDPHEWRKEKDALAERERANEAAGISVHDDVDELDNEDEEDDDDVKPKKRKRDSAAADKKEGKGRAKGKRKTKKSAEQIESEDEEDKGSRADKPTSSKAEKERPSKRAKKESIAPMALTGTAPGNDDEGDDAAMANDPEAAKVKEWRHKLQRAFLTKSSPAPEEMAGLDTVFTTVENYDKMTVEYLSYSKIGKVMRKIIQLPSIPSDDQYHFRQRAQSLVTKWQQLITTSEDGSPSNNTNKEKVASSSGKPANSTSGKPKSSKAASDKDAPAEPEPAANGVQANGGNGSDSMKVDS
ncbi:PWWP domain-containing protein2 [Schizosaccharomyces pombe 972h-] [Rhizoctonia solani]|uniref:PWWP domain-containing protein2 [Schizosaccharomyces pombe 972h-] n=1 Tax=Rhizoctonia solani TaxID=456999 RepID=A0A0K6FWK7_9AGAM|nr:PWWP domain-containing protein2 [Schizosaccharomyces pombe 972h-] [Rhizoctonia solani]